jgi:regulatory protein
MLTDRAASPPADRLVEAANPRLQQKRSGIVRAKADPIAEAVRYLARGDRSAAQVQRQLARRGFSGAAIRRALRTLHRLGYVADEAVALRVAEARLARRPMAREALAAELEARGFSAGAVARAVEQAYAGLSDEDVAQRFLKSLPRRFSDPVREGRRRAGLLRGRGFSADVRESVLGFRANHS